MLQSMNDVREGFICPQCHLDMSTMDMLQGHFQEVHMKQPSSTVKGILLNEVEFLFENFFVRFIFIGKTKD
jgi:hypothetical protein